MTLIKGLDANRPVDLVLINTPSRDYEKRPKESYKDRGSIPPFGLAYIATAARHTGFNAGVLDAEFLRLSDRDIADQIAQAAPRWAGINLFSITYGHSARILRQLPTDIKIMLGGPHARACPDDILRDAALPRIDALVIGEGETRVVELLKDTGSRARLPLVHWVENGSVRQGAAPADARAFLAPDLTDMPLVDRRFLENSESVTDGLESAKIIASRGCPYDCTFCGSARSAAPDVAVRHRGAHSIIAEMKALRREKGVRYFDFLYELFLISPCFINQFTHALENEKELSGIRWEANGRVDVFDRIDAEGLTRLKNAGLSKITLGIESGSDAVLARIKKQTSVDAVRRVSDKVLSAGIHLCGNFIFGFPDETPAQMRQTADLVRHLYGLGRPGKFSAFIYEFFPFPGTQEARKLIAAGKLQPTAEHGWEQPQFICAHSGERRRLIVGLMREFGIHGKN
ncbi:MAG: radical SAM protein [Alphaproteobacteria bacterium]|nr:radical SAM protein [Alphaproteobacteria bacterium]